MVIPKNVSATAPLPVNRWKRFTILNCIFEDGSFCKLMIILPKKTVPKEVFDMGFTPSNALFAY